LFALYHGGGCSGLFCPVGVIGEQVLVQCDVGVGTLHHPLGLADRILHAVCRGHPVPLAATLTAQGGISLRDGHVPGRRLAGRGGLARRPRPARTAAGAARRGTTRNRLPGIARHFSGWLFDERFLSFLPGGKLLRIVYIIFVSGGYLVGGVFEESIMKLVAVTVKMNMFSGGEPAKDIKKM